MTRPIDLVLDRLGQYKLRDNGRDRWRAICPVCGERNPNTLSIGVGDADQVLLKCFKLGCGAEQIAGALGLGLSELFPESARGASPMRRRRLLTAAQALELLESEIALARHCAAEMANGEPLDVATRERLLLGAARVSMMRDEVSA